MNKENFLNKVETEAKRLSRMNPDLHACIKRIPDGIQILFPSRAEMRDQWVREMLDELHRNYPKSIVKVTSPERKIIVVEFREWGRVCGTGVALCSPTDKFDIGVGIAVAYAKWKGILVPDFV